MAHSVPAIGCLDLDGMPCHLLFAGICLVACMLGFSTWALGQIAVASGMVDKMGTKLPLSNDRATHYMPTTTMCLPVSSSVTLVLLVHMQCSVGIYYCTGPHTCGNLSDPSYSQSICAAMLMHA